MVAADELSEIRPALAFDSMIEAVPLIEISPEELGLTNVTGSPNLHAHELRSTSGADGDVWAAVVTVDPCSFDYEFAGDETVHVLEGEATVEVNGEHTVELRPGTIASFRRGTRSRWRIDKRLREFAVLSGA